MDAARDVTHREPGRSAERAGLREPETARSSEQIREEISITSQALHDRIHELRSRVEQRVGSLQNPLHIRERVQARPFVACGIATVVGFLVGARRGYHAPLAALRGVGRASGGIMRGMGHTVGAQVTSTILSRLLAGGR
jgi:hypothetical protein